MFGITEELFNKIVRRIRGKEEPMATKKKKAKTKKKKSKKKTKKRR